MCQISAKPVTTAKNALTKPIALLLGISIGAYRPSMPSFMSDHHPAAPAATAFSTLVWNVQVPRRINATRPRSNSSKSLVLQPLAEAGVGPSPAVPGLPYAAALSDCLNRSWSRYAKRRLAVVPAARRGRSQAGLGPRAPQRRETRNLQNERDSLPRKSGNRRTPALNDPSQFSGSTPARAS